MSLSQLKARARVESLRQRDAIFNARCKFTPIAASVTLDNGARLDGYGCLTLAAAGHPVALCGRCNSAYNGASGATGPTGPA
jgi:hypothetical protein